MWPLGYQAWVRISILLWIPIWIPIACHVTLGESLNFFTLWFAYLQIGLMVQNKTAVK